MFTKLLKVSVAMLRRLNIRLIIHLDDVLVMAKSREELVQHRYTLIFLLQHLGFVLNVKKINILTLSGDRVSRGDSEFKEDEHFTPSQENRGDNITMLPGKESFLDGSDQVDRETLLYCSSNITCKVEPQIPASPTILGNEKRFLISARSDIVTRFSAGTLLVDRQSKTSERSSTNFVSHRHVHDDGCLSERMGCILPGTENRGLLVYDGKISSHQCSRKNSSEVCDFNVYKDQETQTDPSQNGQYGCPYLFIENGGSSEHQVDSGDKNMELSDKSWDHD